MELKTNDVPADSSTATLEVPRDGEAYATWGQTGKLPEAKPAQPKGESAPPKESSAEGQEPKGKSAPVSETGKQDQESKKPPRDNAATRLNEIPEDLRKANLTPAELKTFRREAQKAAEQVEQPKQAAPEKTENPTELKPPTKPKVEDFKTYEEFEAAKDKYLEDMADYKAAKKFQEFHFEQAPTLPTSQSNRSSTRRRPNTLTTPLPLRLLTRRPGPSYPTSRYRLAVKAIIDQSDVWPDIVYTLSKPEELQAFIKLAKENPGAPIRKAVLIEHLITQELSKGGKSPQAGDESRVVPIRDESGKFQKTPEKKNPTRRDPRVK